MSLVFGVMIPIGIGSVGANAKTRRLYMGLTP